MSYNWIDIIKQTILDISLTIQQSFSKSDSRSLHITGAAGTLSILMGLGKILSGLLSLSVFACMNGCYTLGMALARYCALAGLIQTDKKRSQYDYYRLSGIVMIIASLLYVAYSLWTIWHPKTVYYGEIMAITIAAITFAEIGMNVRGIIKYRKAKTPVLHCIKTISLGTSLISCVLTQAAIFSFKGNTQSLYANGILGSIMGGIAGLLGCFMVWRIGRIQVQNGKEESE